MAKKANFRPEAAFLFSICCAGSRGVDRLIGLAKLPDFSRSRPWSWTPGWVFLSLLVMAGCGTVSRSPSASPTTITIFGLGLVHTQDVPFADRIFAGGLAAPEGMHSFELRFRRDDESFRILEGIASNFLSDPVVAGVVVNARDVSERRQAEIDRKSVV